MGKNMQNKRALITGIAGQDGAYLAQFLLHKGYEVHGLLRWDSYAQVEDQRDRLNTLRIDNEINLHVGDITDANNVTRLISEIRPDEIYNLAGMSQVKVSFETPSSTLDINASGTLNILEAVRNLNMAEHTRIYQASSSEMFGTAPAPQNEETPMHPCSPYAVSKLAAYHLMRTYRKSYELFAANGILFNHESPLRGEDFVTRKITRAVVEIEAGRTEPLRLGNLESLRDWGAAQDYVEGMWLMLQHETPDDFVLATGEAHSVRALVERAFAHTGIEIKWRGSGLAEQGFDAKSGKVLVEVDPQFFRPSEVDYLLGDAQKAQDLLGWKPRTHFDALVSEMVNADRALLRNGDVAWQMIG